MLTREELETFGITGVALTDVELIRSPAPTAGQALGVREAAQALALVTLLQQGIQPPLEAAVPSLRERGATLAFLTESPNLVRIRTVSGDDALAIKGPAHGVVQYPDDSGTVYWDTSKQSRLVLGLPSGFAVLEPSAGGLSVQVDAPSLVIATLDQLDAPLADWAGRIDDAWSASQLRSLAAIGSRWSCVIGAGLLGRLFESSSAAEGVRSARRVVHMDPVEPPVWPRLWARSLTETQCKTVADLGLAEVDVLHQVLEDVLSGETEPAEWRSAWADVCHRRDDLACAVFVLHQAQAESARLGGALTDLDSRGKSSLFSLPLNVVQDDERMRRIRATDPLAWWGSPGDIGPLL